MAYGTLILKKLFGKQIQKNNMERSPDLDRKFCRHSWELRCLFTLLHQLTGMEFTWKNSGKKSYGVIAQMFEKVLPELVSETPDGKKTVNYIPIIAFLLEAVKKQQQDIDILKKDKY